MQEMKPINKYLIDAAIQWIIDSECTPHLVVNATMPNTDVPLHLVQEGKIILNVSTSAVTDFFLDEQAISFKARFSGKVENIYVPIYAVEAIYARETGAGMPLMPMDIEEMEEEKAEEPKPTEKKFNGLKIVK